MSETAHAVAHQFDDLEQQHEADRLGMWAFLVTEVLFFGGLICAYAVYRHRFPQAFAVASHELDIMWGGINTVVLICSSLTMALAVHSASAGNNKRTAGWLVMTILLGSAFLGIKAIEYGHKFEHHLVPGTNFAFHDARHEGSAQIFFSLYFAMTGLHAFHMIIGLGILSFLTFMALRGEFASGKKLHVELSGLYWHFVDIVWIFLFPLLYLIGRHV